MCCRRSRGVFGFVGGFAAVGFSTEGFFPERMSDTDFSVENFSGEDLSDEDFSLDEFSDEDFCIEGFSSYDLFMGELGGSFAPCALRSAPLDAPSGARGPDAFASLGEGFAPGRFVDRGSLLRESAMRFRCRESAERSSRFAPEEVGPHLTGRTRALRARIRRSLDPLRRSAAVAMPAIEDVSLLHALFAVRTAGLWLPRRRHRLTCPSTPGPRRAP
jgi:hypothetical protein